VSTNLLKTDQFAINGVSLPTKNLSNTRKSKYQISEKEKLIATLSIDWPKCFGTNRDLYERDVFSENETATFLDFDTFEEHYLNSNEAKFPEGRDTFDDGIDISIKLTLHKTELFGDLLARKNLFRAAERHLFNNYGPARFFAFDQCEIKKDRSETYPFPFIEYIRNHGKEEKSLTKKYETYENIIGFCIAISENRFILVETKISLRGANFSYQQSLDYIDGFAELMLSNIYLKLENKPEYTAFSIDEDYTLDWSQFTPLKSRYEIERDLINRGLVTQKECFFQFSEDDLKSETILVFGDDDTTSLLVEDLVPQESLSDFTGKISIPEAKSPDNPVEKYIKEAMDNYTEALRAYYAKDRQDDN